MNGFTEATPAIDLSDTATRQVSYEEAVLRLQRSRPSAQAALARKPTVMDSRVNSLKILALTLLRQIESLEQQSDDDTPPELNLQDEVHNFEAELIRCALVRTGGRQRRAARLLGMKVTTMNTKIRRYRIQLTDEELKVKNGSGISQQIN